MFLHVGFVAKDIHEGQHSRCSAARTFHMCASKETGDKNVRLADLPEEAEVSVQEPTHRVTRREERGAMTTKDLMKHVRVHLGTIRHRKSCLKRCVGERRRDESVSDWGLWK